MGVTNEAIIITVLLVVATVQCYPYLQDTKQSKGQKSIGDDVDKDEPDVYLEDDIAYYTVRQRNGVRSESARWSGGVIPYYINPGFDTSAQNLILEAMDAFHQTTCIRFKAYTGDEDDYVDIKLSEHTCSSHIGREGGRQSLRISTKCATIKGKIIHELMHAVGFYHEQSRADRDNYVDIYWNNILQGEEKNFKKHDTSETNDFGVSYDYGSVMHYSTTSFSRNGQPTMLPKDQNAVIGQRKGLSPKDIQKIRSMYKCQ